MAIRIPILTSFDPKGLKSANAAFGNLQGSVRSLGSNFAALGVALAGAGALIAKNVQSLARIESINAQTAQTITSMGNAANISAGQVEALAARLEALTATEAESIQEGANLLLTFRNISDQAGAGNDIFSQTTAIMVDMGRALGEGASASAIRLGKALNDPITGLTALRKVGVGFTAEQEAQIKTLQNSGDIMGAQKVILAELQAQFGGSGAAYAKTFSGQLDLMGHELGTIGEEATMAVMPALQGMIEQLRLLIPEIGPKLKAAIESVDWKGLTTAIVDVTTFFIQNIETIGKVVAAIFILNTAFKLMAVASGIVKVALALQTWFTAQLAVGTGAATIATNLLSAAMRLIPFVAVIAGLMVMADTYNKTKIAIEQTLPSLGKFETETIAVANSAALFSPYLNVLKQIIFALLDASDAAELFAAASTNPLSPNQGANRARRNALREQNRRAGLIGSGPTGFAIPNIQAMLDAAARGGSGASTVSDSLNELIASQQQAANQEAGILDKRLSAFESFNNAVKGLFGQIKESILSSFNLPTLGSSINSITRNIGKLLEKTKSFAQNISKLAGLGLNPALLQQVIGAGPMAGSQLAAALVGGGSAFVSQLNSAYSEFGGLASGIAGAGVTSAFNTPTMQNTYNIEVNGGVGSGPSIGKAIVDAIKSYERTSGAVWQGA
jgi:Holliday junction resolvasome RuvABC DNA-binding subunit